MPGVSGASRSGLQFSTLRAGDLMAIELQPSQTLVLGQAGGYSAEEAEVLSEQPVAWTVRQAGRILCCAGILETFPGEQGTAWALLAPGIGMGHLELTRFLRARIAECGLARVELAARGSEPVDPWLDSASALKAALRRPSPEVRWAVLLGMAPVHVLRLYGATGESVVLFEKFPRLEAALATEMGEAA